MQIKHTITTMAGDATIGNDDEIVSINGHFLRAEEARAMACALSDAANRADERREQRRNNYRRATEAHARQLLESVQ